MNESIEQIVNYKNGSNEWTQKVVFSHNYCLTCRSNHSNTKKCYLFSIIVLLIALFLVIYLCILRQCWAENHPWIPQPRDANWIKRHEALVNQTLVHGKDEKIVFIGDSITQGWGGNGKAVWTKYYTPRHAYNYGIGGDRTEHVLWRIDNKEFDGLKPKVAVLMIGTNNLGGNTVEDIAHGVNEILKQLAVKMPETKVLMLGVLPRAEPLGAKAKQLNVLLKKLADEKTVYWLDMWLAFEDTEGHQKTDLYVADKLHLDAMGYEVWQKTMEPLLSKLDPATP